MREIYLQLLGNEIDNQWWQALLRHFVRFGEPIELRCWNGEAKEIEMARAFGRFYEKTPTETVLRGTMSETKLIELLAMPLPEYTGIHHKMTCFFTLNFPRLHSEHYGTEMVLRRLTDDDVHFIEVLLANKKQYFSVIEYISQE